MYRRSGYLPPDAGGQRQDRYPAFACRTPHSHGGCGQWVQPVRVRIRSDADTTSDTAQTVGLNVVSGGWSGLRLIGLVVPLCGDGNYL